MATRRNVFIASLFLSAALFSVVRAANIGTSLVVTVIPNVPTNLTATANSQSQITLSWSDNSNNEDGFSIERSVGNNTSYVVIATTSPNIATFSDTGLLASTLYYYRVDAFNSDGFSAYTAEATTTTPAAQTPPPPGNGSGGGGGGGGGAINPPFQTSAIFRGIAYPSSNITLLQNGQVAAVTQSGPDARFEIDLSNLNAGTYNFGVWAADPAGNRSITQTFQITVSNGATTVISGIFFPPTIGTDKIKVKRGDLVTIIGYTAPQVTVTVMVHSDGDPIIREVTSTDAGVWAYSLNTDLLAFGDHTARARAATGNSVTTDSAVVSFTVGNQNVAAPVPTKCPTKGDIDADCKVNLVDFSIMAYWYGRNNPPTDIDLNGDGAITLVDFSILAYYWTG